MIWVGAAVGMIYSQEGEFECESEKERRGREALGEIGFIFCVLFVMRMTFY